MILQYTQARTHAQMAEVLHPDARASFDSSPIRRAQIQLFGNPYLGSTVWYIQGHDGVCCSLLLSKASRSEAWRDAEVWGWVSRRIRL